MHHRDLHLADWDNDGAYDIIYTNPIGGAIEVFIKQYPKTEKWDWQYLSNPASGVGCKQEKGIGIDDCKLPTPSWIFGALLQSTNN